MDLLQLSGLRKAHPAVPGSDDSAAQPGGETLVLDVEHFEMAPGELVGLVGASGTGKTTLLHVIAGIVRADEGTVRVSGHDLTAMAEAERDAFRARHLGYVFQRFHLLQAFSALENVLLGMSFAGRPDRSRARAMLERLGLAERLHHKPRELSVGQQQRVALARALAGRPELVLADEPTGSLDPRRARSALELLRDVCRENDAGLLCVSHDPKALSAFDRVVEFSEINRATLGAETP